MRQPLLCLLLLLALCSTTARAPIPVSSGDSGPSVAASRQFTKIAPAKRESSSSIFAKIRRWRWTTSSTIKKSPHLPAVGRSSSASSLSSPTVFTSKSDKDESAINEEQSHHVNHNIHSSPTTSVQRPTSSISVGTTDVHGLSFLQNALRTNLKSPSRILRGAAFCAQLTIIWYLSKATWKVMKEAWDEVNEEFAAARGHAGGSRSGDVREEQDMPYADEDALSGLGLSEEDDSSSSGEEEESESNAEDDNVQSKKGQKKWQLQNNEMLSPQMTATRELASRLHSAGIPYASELDDDTPNNTRTVEEIVRSLTRSEGSVLTQTLLSPLDGGMVGSSVSNIEPEHATAAWNAIGGLSDAKESLLDLAFPLIPTQQQHNSEANDNYYGGLLANPPGVLLYGPPGCGKTMLVRALAYTVGARFLAISPSCLLRKYVGETNLNVRALFSVARKISPCVIFVDELDGLFRERGGEDHDVSRDLKTEFLQLWDGIRNHAVQGGSAGSSGGSSSSILVIGATNRPFDVDPAFLRRMPRRVFVGLPDYDSRISVLQSMLHHVPLDANFDINHVASKLGGYSPSDIREVLQTAALYPLREARAEAMRNSQLANSGDGEEQDNSMGNIPIRIQMPPLRRLRTDDILRALQYARPTHFSRRYQRELMNYVRRSGGSNSLGNDSRTGSNSPSVTDVDDNYIADAGTFRGDYFNEDEPDSEYDYDESSSSDYDEF